MKGGFHFGCCCCRRADSILFGVDRQTHLISSRGEDEKEKEREMVRSKMMTDCGGGEKMKKVEKRDTLCFGKFKPKP